LFAVLDEFITNPAQRELLFDLPHERHFLPTPIQLYKQVLNQCFDLSVPDRCLLKTGSNAGLDIFDLGLIVEMNDPYGLPGNGVSVTMPQEYGIGKINAAHTPKCTRSLIRDAIAAQYAANPSSLLNIVEFMKKMVLGIEFKLGPSLSGVPVLSAADTREMTKELFVTPLSPTSPASFLRPISFDVAMNPRCAPPPLTPRSSLALTHAYALVGCSHRLYNGPSLDIAVADMNYEASWAPRLNSQRYVIEKKTAAKRSDTRATLAIMNRAITKR
jgi:hypothetical protein